MGVQEQMSECRICPRNCGIDRTSRAGACGCPAAVRVNLAQLHRHEEPVISGTRGSGTIFFSGCNMHCVYCQNAVISQECRGRECTTDELVQMMLELEEQGAHNINLVTGTHFTPQLAGALELAKKQGLGLPVVWNSKGYELVETLRMLDGLVDVYQPDFRYWDGQAAEQYSAAPGYARHARAALSEMLRQVGHIRCDRRGLAWRGLMIRLLVLPQHINNVAAIIEWFAVTLGTETWVSLMGQYYPAHRAGECAALSRQILAAEYACAVKLLSGMVWRTAMFRKSVLIRAILLISAKPDFLHLLHIVTFRHTCVYVL
jgi:putative pyruvate formate lyase activating enzyme